MTVDDVPAVVGWHLQAFPEGFYARLGSGFMRRWMGAHLLRPAAVSLVAHDADDRLVGYLLGTTDDAVYSTGSLALSAGLAGRGAVALLARPRLWSNFVRVRARSYAARAVRSLKTRRVSGSESRVGELIYICVETRYRQRGGGAALLDAFVGEARRSGTQRLHLVTEEDNGTARRFYDRRGWCTAVGSRTALDGRPLVRMERDLNGSPR
jgi:ribosomal protein S18 acetylase RimI-like enzyme